MATAPDFSFKSSFPIASIVEAAQRRAQLEDQNQQQGNQALIQGLQTFGQGVDSLVTRRREMAQAVQMGSALGLSPEETHGLSPEQVVQVGTAKGKQLDLLQLMALSNPAVTKEPWFVAAVAAKHPATAQTTAAPTATASTASPAMPQVAVPQPTLPNISGMPLAPPTTGSFDVSQGTTTTKPSDLLPGLLGKPMNAATSAAGLKMIMANRQEPVVTRSQAEGQGSVQHGTHILPDDKTTDILNPTYQGKLEKQYADNKMKALSNRSGGLGLQDSKVNQAIDLRKMVNKYYDPKTGDYAIPPSLHSELALGLARLLSPGGQVGIELMHELRQSTGREALAKVLIYAGADPAQVGGATQSVVRMFIDSVDRQGETAEQLRDQYMQYISDNAPTDLEPSRKAKHDQGKLNSFNGFLAKAPDHQAPQTVGLSQEEQDFIAKYEAKHGITK